MNKLPAVQKNPYPSASEVSGDIEAGRFDFESKLAANPSINVRHGFIKKVYFVLAAQLVLTTIVGAITASFRESIMKRPGFLILALILNFGLYIAAVCVPSMLRTYPRNYIMLGALSVTQGFLLGVVTAKYSSGMILAAIGFLAFLVFGLSVFAMQTKYDFTTKASYLFAGSLALMGCMIIGLWFRHDNTARLIISCIGIILFSLYLVYDTQLIVGGKNTAISLDVDEYAYGALMLYIDIINLFQFILSFLDSSSN